MSDVYDRLAHPFPAAVLRKNPKGMTYIPVSEVHARLNNVLGVGNWSYEVLNVRTHGEFETETGTYPKWIVAQVQLKARIQTEPPSEENGWPITFDTVRHGFGGQEVQFTRNNKGPVDIGDAYKGAVSDALKKAAQSMGVGLDIARTEEALEEEREAREAEMPKADEETIGNVASAYDALDETQKKAFRRGWGKISGGKKMTGGKVTVAEAEAALELLAELAEAET
jgi:hypothetical protein